MYFCGGHHATEEHRYAVVGVLTVTYLHTATERCRRIGRRERMADDRAGLGCWSTVADFSEERLHVPQREHERHEERDDAPGAIRPEPLHKI